jgi:hypothetical protein
VLHKLALKRRRLGRQRLIVGGVPGEQVRDIGRHLIGGRGQHRDGRSGRRRVGRADIRSSVAKSVAAEVISSGAAMTYDIATSNQYSDGSIATASVSSK